MEKTCSLRFLLDGDFFKIADPDLPNELVILPLLLFEGVALSTDLYDIRIDACLLELQPIEDRLLFQALTATVTKWLRSESSAQPNTKLLRVVR